MRKVSWKRAARAAKFAMETGRVVTPDELRRAEYADRIKAVVKRDGVWWPPSHEGSWTPWN
jgi:hypothetical protein